jgi:replication factor A1
VTSRSDGSTHRVADILVGDETGCITMTLWDDAIDKVNEADVINVKNGYVSLFKGSMRLNTGKYGSFDKSEKTIGDVNTENNLSNRRFEEERRYSSFFRSAYGGERDRDDRRRGGRGYRRRY